MQVVRHDRSLEQIVFPIPEICEYLTGETKRRTYLTAERDDQGSKVADFFNKSELMYTEMTWQKNLRSQPYLFIVSKYMPFWSTLILWCSIAINFIVAKFYPFDGDPMVSSPSTSGIVWASMLTSLAVMVTVPNNLAIKTLILSCLARMILTCGPAISLWILGVAIVIFKGVHLVSIIGNMGTLNKSLAQVGVSGCYYHHHLSVIHCHKSFDFYHYLHESCIIVTFYRQWKYLLISPRVLSLSPSL